MDVELCANLIYLLVYVLEWRYDPNHHDEDYDRVSSTMLISCDLYVDIM